MPEPSHAGWLLAAALAACLAGMGWLALAMEVHARQVWGRALARGSAKLLRLLGATALAASLWLCLAADHATMAVLVWVMALSAAAMLVAFMLSSQPQRLRVFAPWIR